MRKLLSTLAAIALSAAAHAEAQEIAPPVQPKPAASAETPAPTSASEEKAAPARNAEQYQAALAATAAQTGTDPALDGSLVRVMSSLAGVGRCGDAAGLASREGRQELATRVQQLCN